MAEPVQAPVLKRDPRSTDFPGQVEDLSAALQEWRRTREYSQQTEERLAQITVQCARLVESWQLVEQRRNGDTRLQNDMGDRIHTLEHAIEEEWEALRGDHDDAAPPRREEPSAPPENSATQLTLAGLASTESRIAALERDLEARMEQLSRDLQLVLAELRHARPQPAAAGAAAFPLESVMRIHEELRESDPATAAAPLKPGATRALPEWTESATALTKRLESVERAIENAGPAAPQSRRPQLWVLGIAAASLAGLIVFSMWTQRRVDARLNDAAARISAAEQQRDTTVAATRAEASRQVADARQSAAQAQIVGNVLAAPDRIRYWLNAADPGSRAYAQLLFSRSRGMVFSASRLPPAGAGRTYQLWLLTAGGPVSAGVFAPDTAGRVTLVTESNDGLRGRLTGPVVTLEPDGGSAQPTGRRVLIRID